MMTPRPLDLAPPTPVRARSRTGRTAGYVAGPALLAGTVLFLLDAAGLPWTGIPNWPLCTANTVNPYGCAIGIHTRQGAYTR
jgi:hypothetical protein